APATVTVHITPVNDPPVAIDDGTDDSIKVNAGGSITFNLVANDVDVDNSIDFTSVEIIADSGPQAGTLINNLNGTVTYTHNLASNAQSDSFRYTIRDVSGTISNEATVTISVKNTYFVVDSQRFFEGDY